MQQYKKRKHVITTATFHVDLGNILEKFELWRHIHGLKWRKQSRPIITYVEILSVIQILLDYTIPHWNYGQIEVD